MAYEFGRVDDGQPPASWRGVSAQFGYLLDAPGGDAVGFKVVGFSAFDPEELDELWGAPLFHASLLGLPASSAGEIVLAAQAHFDGQSSLNRQFFQAASREEGEKAVRLWRACLATGDAMAHFGLGTTLHDVGRHAEAYLHLRHYTEIAPHGAWSWCWYGYAAESIGEHAEARRAYARAIELEEDGGEETDASERLQQIGGESA